MVKTYSELILLPTFQERFEYLRLNGQVGMETFGFNRVINQELYHSYEWQKIRRKVIIRDEGCDLGIDDHPIADKIIIHHINPITEQMIIDRDPMVFDLNNLVCCGHITHNAIHYSDASLLPKEWVPRTANDMIPWR